MKRSQNRKAGFTLVEIMIVVAIIGMLAAIAVPNFIKARQSAQKASCQSQLKQIQGCKVAWALEMRKKGTDTLSGSWDAIVPSYIAHQPFCPAGGTYTLGAVAENVSCELAPSPDWHTFPI